MSHSQAEAGRLAASRLKTVAELQAESPKLAEYKSSGAGFLRGRCIFPDQHKHGDRSASAWLRLPNSDDDPGSYGCSGCGAKLNLMQLAEALGADPYTGGNGGGAPATAKAATTAKPTTEQVTIFAPADATQAWRDARTYTETILAAPTLDDADQAVIDYLERRGLPDALAREDAPLVLALLPPRHPALPSSHRAVAPLYRIADGAVQSIQGRTHEDRPDRKKVRFPKGSTLDGGSAFASEGALRLLRAEADPPAEIVLVEGLTAYAAAALEVGAVLGAPGAGQVPKVLQVNGKPAPWLRDLIVTIWSDGDQVGQDNAADAERVALDGGAVVRRASWSDTEGNAGDAADARKVDGPGAVRDAIAKAVTVAQGAGVFLASAMTVRDFLQIEIPPRKALVGGGVFKRGDQVLLAGKAGAGKGYLSIQLAVALATGTDWVGLPTQRSRVALVGLEDADDDMQERWQAVTKEHPEALDHIVIAPRDMTLRTIGGPVDLVAHAAALAQWCKYETVDLLVLDPLSKIQRTDINADETLAPYLDAWEMLTIDSGAAVLIVHHERKGKQGAGADDDLDSIKGSQRLTGDPRAVLRLLRSKGKLVLRFPKVSHGRAPSPIWLDQNDDGLLVLAEEPESTGARNMEKVANVIAEADGPLNRAAIERRVGLSRGPVGTWLKKLIEAGEVERIGTGKSTRYCLSAHVAQVAQGGQDKVLQFPDLQD